ncbi:MAG: guanylate kinase [Candidatus Brocadiia bacterium]
MSRPERQQELVNPRQLFVISGPSGVGKNTVAAELCRRGLAVRAVTATSREPRPGEEDGADYLFISEDEFERWIEEGRLLEYTRYVGNYYGTPVESVNRAAAEGLPVLLTIDVDGGLQIKRRWPEVTLIFLEPPSERELRRRLEARGRDEDESIERRLRRARQEMEYAERYDHRVVNDRLEDALSRIQRIMEKRYPIDANQPRPEG